MKDVRAQNKTVVAWIREEGASGGYWIATTTNHIVANRMSITGSIGVYGSYLQFDQFLAHWNVTYNRLVAGDRKDLGDPFVNLTSEDKAFYQQKLDKLHSFFIEEVATNRNMSVANVTMLADGQIFLGVEAKEVGLVDELGGKNEATAYLEKRLGEKVELVDYTPKHSWIDDLLGLVGVQRQPDLTSLARDATLASSSPSPQFQ